MAGAAPVRLALVGLGWAVCELWEPAIGNNPGFTVVAVHDPDPDAVAWAVDRFPTVRILPGAADLLPDEVDLAVVATPNHVHAVTAVALLERGIATFVEKPVCVSSVEAAALAVAERTGGATMLAGSAAWYRRTLRRCVRYCRSWDRCARWTCRGCAPAASPLRAGGSPDATGPVAGR
jgi:oxidoreductase